MTRLILTTILLTAFKLLAQESILVADLTLKVAAMSTELIYYGFAVGDDIEFTFKEVNGKPIKEVEIMELPNHSKFMDFKASGTHAKTIKVNQTAVYEFRFKNGPVKGRICQVHIARKPAHDSLVSFNTNWEWQAIYDTMYVPYTEDSLVGYDTLNYKETVKELIDTKLVDDMIVDKTQKVHSYWNENSSYTYLRVDLPSDKKELYREEKVIAWVYWIGVGDQARKAYAQNVKAFGELASAVTTAFASPLAGLAVGAMSELATPKIGDDVEYQFLPNFENAKAYVNNLRYFRFDYGKGTTAYGKNSDRLAGTFYIGLHNDHGTRGIDVDVKVVVIKEVKTFEDITYDRQRITPRYVKLNKRRMVVSKSQIMVNAG